MLRRTALAAIAALPTILFGKPKPTPQLKHPELWEGLVGWLPESSWPENPQGFIAEVNFVNSWSNKWGKPPDPETVKTAKEQYRNGDYLSTDEYLDDIDKMIAESKRLTWIYGG